MNPLFLIFAFALVAVQFAIPRRYAFAPLLIAACHFQNVPVLEVGVSFSVTKLVILAGLLRAMSDRTFVWSARNPMDLWIAIWAGWMLVSGFAHNPPGGENPITIRMSQIYGIAGAYLYARAFIADREDFLNFSKCLALVVIPLALVVFWEKTSMHNFYSAISGLVSEATIRGERVRAAGPFSHPILLGTFGATVFLLLVPMRRIHPRWFMAGAAASAAIVFCSASSSSIMTLFSGMMGIGLWRFRRSVRSIRMVVLFVIVALHFMMQAPVWYLMARIDLAGGSTGWHRAELISAGINHLSEWWLTGTDYTRNWLPYGVEWSENHIDITNYYLQMGVTGGLPLMISFIIILVKGFQQLGRQLRVLRREEDPSEFTLWCVGATLFAHCFTFLSVSYFDQSYVGLCMVLGLVPGLCAPVKSTEEEQEQETSEAAEPQATIGGAIPSAEPAAGER